MNLKREEHHGTKLLLTLLLAVALIFLSISLGRAVS